jgi:hypothetical protein
MKNLSFRIVFGSLLVLSSIMAAQAQSYKFDGYVRNTDDYTTKTTFPGATVQIYTESDTSPTFLTNCATPAVSIPNNVTADSIGYFCFKGPATRYNLVVTATGLATKKYRWITEELGAPGVYSLKDFGAKGDGSDETFLIKSAMAFIGSRAEIGGLLNVPNGVFKVRGDAAGTYNQAGLPIVLPPGLTLAGTNAKFNFSSSRIQLDINDKTIFMIGNHTDEITIRDLALVTPMVSSGGGYIPRPGTKAIHARGSAPNSSQNFVFSNITIQGFDTCIHVDGIPDANGSKGWQFDYVKLDNSLIAECNKGIHFDTLNTDWQISNSQIGAVKDGVAMLVDNMATLQITSTFGGGPPASAPIDRTKSAKAWLWIRGQHSNIDIQGCETENARHAILYDWDNTIFDYFRPTLKVQNSLFGDQVKFRANVAYVSIGNQYGANSVKTMRAGTVEPFPDNDSFVGSSRTQIYSFGDQFVMRNYELENCPPNTVGYPQFPTAPNPSVSCKRDFLVDNSGGETNAIVMRTSQKRNSTNDSESIESNLSQSPLKITSPPAYGSNIAWGYSIERSLVDGFLEFKANQRPPLFSYNAAGYRFDSHVYPATDAQYELGNGAKRWSLIRGVTVVSGDTILSDKVSGKELFKIHEDENNIFFQDIRTGKEMMRIDRKGNLFVAGRIFQSKKPSHLRTQKARPARGQARR